MVPDDHWADLAERIPGGFAGVLYSNGKPVLMLTHPEQATAAKKVLTSDRTLAGFDVMRAEVRTARWDFAQLVDWFNYFVGHSTVWNTAGIVSGDKDESTNRIHFGIENETGRETLRKKLVALDIPCDLIRISIESPIRLLEK
jgi:hypothetical protein